MHELLPRRRFLQGTLASGALLMTTSARAAKANPPRVKIGQIGTSHAHANKLEVYRRSADYEVVGIVEPDPKRREAALKQPVYRDLPVLTTEELLNMPGLQAVLVETSVRDLLKNAQACIDAGKHVHLDKPAGESFTQYKQLLAVAEKKRLLVQMGYMFRYNPAVQLLHRFLKEGWLGDIFEMHAVMSKVVASNSRKELAEYPGGIMFELGCHVIDLVVGVQGRPDKIQAFHRQSSHANDQLVDNMLAVFEYPQAIATVKSTALEVEGFARRQFTVCGSRGTFHIQPLDAPNVVYSLDRDCGEYKKGTHEIKFGSYPRYVGDAKDMASVLRDEKKCEYSYARDLAVQESVLLASSQPIDR